MPSGVMIDIETLGLAPDSLVLSVAAVNFELDILKGTELPKPPLIGSKSLWVLDVREQLLLGRIVDPETQKWWGEQSNEARAHLFTNEPIPIGTFAIEFQGVVGAFESVWAQNARFDTGILDDLYADLGLKPPWRRHNVIRCTYPIIKEFPQARFMPDDVFKGHEKMAHDPAADCIKQIWKLWEHWPCVST